MDSCRVCMVKDTNMISIFCVEGIVERIYFCTGIQFKEEDGFPTEICKTCLDNLSVAHRFKTLCLLAEETFKNLNCDIKTEETESLKANDMIDDFDTDIVRTNNVKDDSIETNGTIGDMEDATEDLECNKTRKSPRVKMKVIKDCVSEQGVLTVRNKRGPYNKAGTVKRVRKFKFRKLFCEPCGLKFSTKQQSDEHKKSTHKDSHRYVCEIAVQFAELHDTAERMLEKGCIFDIIPWKWSRKLLYWRLARLLRQNAQERRVRAAARNERMDQGAAAATLRRWFTEDRGETQSHQWEHDNEAVCRWFEAQAGVEDSVLERNLKAIRQDAVLQACNDLVMELTPSQRAEFIRNLTALEMEQ